ncbi:PREDICTED: aspartic proteinase CDR1-like [Lupinus angustifolius]|uniref:aspartic proteinase CDR1-like n=1 Tax=Lupinus angustifolius TaxID=3871 RepID=UPI00092F05FB|nr:PREDICTED: aspartic proteinase CDR1-like [Lupinus angustifolius]
MASTLNMLVYHYVLIVLSITLSTIFNGDIYLVKALNHGFSVELIHRDSPKSPFYNSSQTQFERTNNAIHRSLNRVKLFFHGAYYNVIQAPITNTNGEFLMKFSIGTPSFDVMAVADTGSDLIWLQCKPCENCYNQTDSIFDPSKSKTYKVASCSSQACKLIKDNSCKNGTVESKCQYKVSYGDASFSNGDVAFETLTFGTNVTNSHVVKIIFGCGHNNHGIFQPKSTGIVGLGNGASSLTSQLGVTIHNKFSYCLARERNIPSLLNFGENAVVSGPGTVSTPLASGRSPTYYYLTLKGMTVAGKKLDLNLKVGPVGNTGNIIIDSGTTLSFLPVDFYNRLESLVVAQIKSERVTDPKLLRPPLKLCYKSSASTLKAPPIIVHFGGADIVLNQLNTFFKFGDGIMCFNFNPTNDVPIYGNIAQVDFLIGIDRQKKTVSFKPTQCSKL